MSYPLAKLDACRAVTIVLRYTPKDVSEVELDLKVSMVRLREAAENICVARTVYCACSLLGCG